MGYVHLAFYDFLCDFTVYFLMRRYMTVRKTATTVNDVEEWNGNGWVR